MGFFKSPYYDAGEYMAYVRFHAAWPSDADPLALALEQRKSAVALAPIFVAQLVARGPGHAVRARLIGGRAAARGAVVAGRSATGCASCRARRPASRPARGPRRRVL